MSAVIRADGGAETFRYDGEGKIALHTGAMGQTTCYRHGAFDLLREMEDAGGQRILCDYDGAARLTQLTRSGNQHWRLHYDAAGQMAGEDDWSGRRTVQGKIIVCRRHKDAKRDVLHVISISL